ncbi:MAG: MarR family transcriptional regulator [Christensenellaceae bacterium]|jgi:DNA-binding MarR family transcriptional regulator|nr:MarR family transcriptional regulator [Christensenellaceae bacterium]
MDAVRDLFFAQQALAALFSVTNKLQVEGDRFLGDLTIRQMLAVPAIFHAPEGGATINHIARQLGTTKQSAKQIVSALEKKNYILSAPSKRDKRAVNLTVTQEGERAFAACSKRADLFLAAIFRDFTTEDMGSLRALLKKLYRFDGAGQESLEEGPGSIEGEAEGILRHHPNYLNERMDRDASEPDPS